ncbi:hypothetical protein TRAPUB_11471 [Trametes pubescens]|uniref:Uncharacterized protein n=1 Tax=Trametes pubescens TaxID=154538 RepID=A0A1M2VWQ2_TRAPU|nr:hypothetical protein TRAPUB_11471 [Trametes pubescens]
MDIYVADPTATTQTFASIPLPPSTTTMKTTAVAPPPTTDTTPATDTTPTSMPTRTSIPTQTATPKDPIPSPTDTSGSTGSEDGNPPIGISTSISRGTAISTSVLPTMSSSPTALSTDGASPNTSSVISSAVMAAMPASPDPPSSSSFATPPTTSDSGPHESSPKVTITLSAALGVTALIAIVLTIVFCVRRRRRRRRMHVALPSRLPENLRVADEDATWKRKGEHEATMRDVHLAAPVACSSPIASTIASSDPFSVHASNLDNDRIISPTTTPQSPQSDTGGSARPLLRRTASHSPSDAMSAVGKAASSLRRTSSTQHSSDMWSRDGVVGEATRAAHPGTLDVGNVEGSEKGKGAAFIRGVEKITTGPDERAFAERRQRLSLPAISPAQPLSLTPPPSGTTTPSARLSMGTSGTRFVPVMVLMEMREAELEEHNQPPPPYQPRSSQEAVGASSSTLIGTKYGGEL